MESKVAILLSYFFPHTYLLVLGRTTDADKSVGAIPSVFL